MSFESLKDDLIRRVDSLKKAIEDAGSDVRPSALGLKRTEAQGGSVTFVQRFGSALNLNIHFHCLVLGGVYYRNGEKVDFRRVEPPTQVELGQVLERIVKRFLKLLTRRGI